MIELISGIIGIVFMAAFIVYIKRNQLKWDITAEALIDLQNRTQRLEAQQKKDREDIAGFVNELIKNNRK